MAGIILNRILFAVTMLIADTLTISAAKREQSAPRRPGREATEFRTENAIIQSFIHITRVPCL